MAKSTRVLSGFAKPAVLIAVSLGFTCATGRGCIAIASSGTARIQTESAVIIWDADRNVEHFIRQATLDTKARSVGFIVPTPTVPKLAVADAAIFDLASYYLPHPNGADLYGETPRSLKAVVVAEQDVGDLHAVTLRTEDNKALHEWLVHNGFSWGEAARSWLAPYAKAHWVITAFKLIKRSDAPLKTKAIRMTFATDHPFFPYSEPQTLKSVDEPERELRIAILSTGQMAGRLANNSAWPGTILDSADIAGDASRWIKLANLNEPVGSKISWVTSFTDDSDPRPGKADLFFYPAANHPKYP